MTKIALINDIHVGCRGSSEVFADHIRKFYSNVFFPYLDEHGIKDVMALGDIVEHRKYINFKSAYNLEFDIIRPMVERGITSHWLIGNHDMYFRNSTEVNSMKALYGGREYPNMFIHEKPAEIEVGNTKILMLPWICATNASDCYEAMAKSTAPILAAHLEVAGFEMYQGSVVDHGVDYTTFEKFDMVLTGHFHHKSSRANIHYLGTQYEITWADHNDQKGFHVLDTDTMKLEFIKNPFTIFHKIAYNDTKAKSLEDIMSSVDFESLRGGHVKLIVSGKINPYWYDVFVDAIEKAEVIQLRVVDETMNLFSDSEDVSQAQDTLTILHNYIEGLDLESNKDELENLMKALYQDAMSMSDHTDQ